MRQTKNIRHQIRGVGCLTSVAPSEISQTNYVPYFHMTGQCSNASAKQLKVAEFILQEIRKGAIQPDPIIILRRLPIPNLRFSSSGANSFHQRYRRKSKSMMATGTTNSTSFLAKYAVYLWSWFSQTPLQTIIGPSLLKNVMLAHNGIDNDIHIATTDAKSLKVSEYLKSWFHGCWA